MPGLYSSRATKFLYLSGARMTGADGPLTKSESETEYLTEKYMPEGSARPVVVQAGLSNEMISLEGYARRDSGAANLILSDDAHALAATPERVVTLGDFGDIVGQKATLYRAMSLAESWKTIPGEICFCNSPARSRQREGRTQMFKKGQSSALWSSLSARITRVPQRSERYSWTSARARQTDSQSATMSSRSNLKTVLR